MESVKIQERIKNGKFRYEIYGVKYEKSGGGTAWRAPTQADYKAQSEAEDRIQSDFELNTILDVQRYLGDEDRAGPYGVTKWRDAFTPRQLVTQYEYLQAFKKCQTEILEKYDEQKAEAILTISLFRRLAEHIDSDAIDEAVDRCFDEIQRAEKPEGASGLFQALLGQAAEFRQPRLQ
jgi:adenine-specific DNA methylase